MVNIREHVKQLVRHCVDTVDPGRGYRFDPKLAERAFTFICSLKQSKGQWSGKPLILQPWQARFVGQLLAVVDSEGERRYRQAFLWVARKNGKSSLVAAISLYLLVLDGERSPDIFIAANDTEQARILFTMAKSMVGQSKLLARMCKCYQNQVLCHKTEGRIKVLSGRAASKHGLNVYCGIIDELHTQETSEMWDVLATGTAARRQPLMIGLSTAGDNLSGWGYECYRTCKSVITGEISNERTLVVVYEAPPEAGIFDREAWRAANPNLGITIDENYLLVQAEQAQGIASRESAFRQLHLNQWRHKSDRWVPVERWQELAVKQPPDIPFRMGARAAICGVDLGGTKSMNAAALMYFPEDERACVYVEFMLWLPRVAIARYSKMYHAIAEAYGRGQLRPAGEEYVDQDVVYRELVSWLKRRRCDMIALDPWQAQTFAAKLERDGFEVVAIKQTARELMAPLSELERLIAKKAILHDGNAAATWCFGNVVIKSDSYGNRRPVKAGEDETIDAVSAVLNAMAAYIAVYLRGDQKTLATVDSLDQLVGFVQVQ